MNPLNRKSVVLYCLISLSCSFLAPSYATPIPSPSPSSTPPPTSSPSPVTFSLTIERDIGPSGICSGCTYDVYVEDPWDPGNYIGEVPVTLNLTEGSHEIYFREICPYNGGGVYFWHWEDGSSNMWPRTIEINQDSTWMMICCFVPCIEYPLADVSINEIAWMGTAYNTGDQWIELYNADNLPIGLMNFRLTGNSMNIELGGQWWVSAGGWEEPGDRKAIPSHGYFLIEKNENCVSDITGDIINTGLNISADGDDLSLTSHHNIVDNVNCSPGWYAGEQSCYYTMERKYPHIDYGNEGNNWADWNGSTWSGRDANGDPLNATAKSINTVYSSNWPPPAPTPSLPPTPPPTITPTHISWELDSCDYNGDGTADIAVFRERSGLWAVRNLTRIYFGTEDDIPVNGDYNGDGTTDVGIFRSDSGLWAIRDVSRAYFGSSEDTPVPLRFNPSSACKIGIFRESSGLWAIKDLTRVYFGSSGDLPVPGDYDGDGTKELGIFRESSGLWALREISRFYFGQSADTPIPGNYRGNGIYSAAIFRGSSGLWASRRISRIYYGTSGDWVVPADYCGDGTTAVGIFRDSSGLWAVRGVTRVYYGTTGDIPVIR